MACQQMSICTPCSKAAPLVYGFIHPWKGMLHREDRINCLETRDDLGSTICIYLEWEQAAPHT